MLRGGRRAEGLATAFPFSCASSCFAPRLFTLFPTILKKEGRLTKRTRQDHINTVFLNATLVVDQFLPSQIMSFDFFFDTKFGQLVLFKKLQKYGKSQIILKVYYIVNEVTVKISDNYEFF